MCVCVLVCSAKNKCQYKVRHCSPFQLSKSFSFALFIQSTQVGAVTINFFQNDEMYGQLYWVKHMYSRSCLSTDSKKKMQPICANFDINHTNNNFTFWWRSQYFDNVDIEIMIFCLSVHCFLENHLNVKNNWTHVALFCSCPKVWFS